MGNSDSNDIDSFGFLVSMVVFILIFLLLTRIIFYAFSVSNSLGIQSIASLLIPWLIIHLIHSHEKDLFSEIGHIPFWIKFPFSIFIGYSMVSLISSIGPSGLLMIDLIFSVIFFLLIYASIVFKQGLIAYYYGIALGFLTYIVYVGPPSMIF